MICKTKMPKPYFKFILMFLSVGSLAYNMGLFKRFMSTYYLCVSCRGFFAHIPEIDKATIQLVIQNEALLLI